MIAIIEYGVGNLNSVKNMFKKIGYNASITSNPEDILKADKILLPGVGAFDNGMTRLNDSGLLPVLKQKALQEKVPVLGICLGMQMLTNGSEEGTLPGLGWIDADTLKFRFTDSSMKVPHMGWNYIALKKETPLFKDMDRTTSRFYFVHSFHVKCNNSSNSLAETTYGTTFSSAIMNDNLFGTQFHPEKSHKFGMQLLTNFAKL